MRWHAHLARGPTGETPVPRFHNCGAEDKRGRAARLSDKMCAVPNGVSLSKSNKEPPMIKKILLGAIVVIGLVVVIFCVVVAMQPSHYHIERSATVNAPASAVFNQVNDFHKWDAWSPWAKLDPNMKQSYEGAPAGNGAMYS